LGIGGRVGRRRGSVYDGLVALLDRRTVGGQVERGHVGECEIGI
jgi:hypothetical protein